MEVVILRYWYLSLALFSFCHSAAANDVTIEKAVFMRHSEGVWQVSVTLRHDDTGWDHYADAWRIVSDGGEVYGTRTLHHPHENEQPFTRSLSGVAVPAADSMVFVEAHDNVHGWAKQKLAVDLTKDSGPGFEVKR